MAEGVFCFRFFDLSAAYAAAPLTKGSRSERSGLAREEAFWFVAYQLFSLPPLGGEGGISTGGRNDG